MTLSVAIADAFLLLSSTVKSTQILEKLTQDSPSAKMLEHYVQLHNASRN